jgi:hypothetical protein
MGTHRSYIRCHQLERVREFMMRQLNGYVLRQMVSTFNILSNTQTGTGTRTAVGISVPVHFWTHGDRTFCAEVGVGNTKEKFVTGFETSDIYIYENCTCG